MRRLILLLVLLVASCSPDFTPQSKVERPRILGIVSEPPEMGFDGTSSLEAVLAFGDRAKGLEWWACPLSLGAALGYQCAVPEIQLAGTGATSSLPAAAVAPYLAGLGAFFQQFEGYLKQVVQQSDTCMLDMLHAYDSCVKPKGADVAACATTATDATLACLHKDGLVVQVRVRVTWQDGTTLDGYKRVLLRDPSPGRQPNHNPRLDAVKAGDVTIESGTVIVADPGQKEKLVPALADGSIEQYVNAHGESAKETVFFTFFSTSGDFEHIRSDPDYPDNRLTMDGASKMPPLTHVWVFVHDDRYGESYVAFDVERRGALADGVVVDASGEVAE